MAFFGAALALLVAYQAWRASRHGGKFYAAEVYGMPPSLHGRIALIALATGLAILCVPAAYTTPLVALETLAATLYLASFARGASDDDPG